MLHLLCIRCGRCISPAREQLAHDELAGGGKPGVCDPDLDRIRREFIEMPHVQPSTWLVERRLDQTGKFGADVLRVVGPYQVIDLGVRTLDAPAELSSRTAALLVDQGTCILATNVINHHGIEAIGLYLQGIRAKR